MSVVRANARAMEARWLKMLARRGDLALAILVVAVIALLVVPLPTLLLDGLIATNLSASIALLMLSLYIPSALGLSTFPSLVLLTTLFRLSLNIASTKLILLNGAAGQVIDTFGRLVVGGNVVVGLVVFLIIAIVQFIVISKGAERVAEVGARFSLDGMPGKQMSIDADLRAGLIDKEEALRRRRRLEEESRLYGAMDGAMKFVKGDAVAGMLIAFVNVVAGIAIGVAMHGMTLGAAVNAYSVLSVGDGMVAQIPSLFVSIAAGIVITRVGGRSRGRQSLGAQIAQEVLGQPTALLAASALVATFLLVPTLPAWPFVTLALMLAAAGYLGRRAAGGQNVLGDHSMTPRERASAGEAGDLAQDADPIAVPLRLRVGPSLRATLSAMAFEAALDGEKAGVARDLGLPFPALKVTLEETLAGARYAIDVQEVQVGSGDLDNSNVLPFTPPQDGAAQNARPSREHALAAHIAWVVRRHAESFIGVQETHELLSRAAAHLPELTAELQKAVPLQRMAEVLRRLVQEGVSIRHVREICESLITWGAREKDIVMLTEYVRVDLGRFIAQRYVDCDGHVHAVVLEIDAEKALREAIQQGPSGSFLALSPETSQALMTAADGVLSSLRADATHVVLASMDVRRYLKRFLTARFPSWAVLSFQELPGDVQVHTVGRIGLKQSPHKRSLGIRGS